MGRLTEPLKNDSRFLSLLLRHNPGLVGLELDPHGWAQVDELLDRTERFGRPITRDALHEIVDRNDKRRFSFSEDRQRIRANQGHTVDIDLDLPFVQPPDVLYYSTAPDRLDRLLDRGIRSGVRPYVQLRPLTHPTLNIGAARRGSLVVEVDAKRMHEDGHQFRRTANDIWLTGRVDAGYIKGWTRH